MKRIIITLLYHPEKGSGAEKVAKEIGERMSQENKVSYIFMGNKNEKKKKGNIEYISIKTPNISGINILIFMYKLLFLLKKIDLDILIDNGGVSGLYLLFFRKNFKLISIVHGLTKATIKYSKDIKFHNLIQKLKYYVFLRFSDITSSYIFKKSDKVVVLSKYLLQEVIEYYGFKKEKIEIIYNGYDPIPNSMYSLINKRHRGITVLFISNDHARKGIKILEDVAKNLSKEDITFFVIGNEYHSKISNIKGIGKMERESLYALMGKSDIIFLPSYYEGQPLVILEAMSLGCIPIISQNCHMDMLENTIFNHFINKKNDSETYTKMFQSLLDKGGIEKMHQTAQECIKAYSRKQQAQKYAELMESL